MAAGTEAIIRSYWERVWLDRDLDRLDELVTDPSTRHTAEGTRTYTLPELKIRIAAIGEMIRGTEMSLDAVTTHGEMAWARLTLRGVSLATMVPITVTWMAQYRIIGGRMAETWALHQVDLDWTE